MNEEQADQIIDLLEDIRNSLADIESHTRDIFSIDSKTSEAADYLKKINNKVR